MKLPVASIVVPVFNKAAYLESCLRSLLAQSYSAFELLLVDDGSADGSAGICEAFCRRDRRVRLIQQPNRGASCARNRGLDVAIGEAIYFSDADDFVHPELLALTLPPFEAQQADYVLFQRTTAEPGEEPNFPAYEPLPKVEPIFDPLAEFLAHDHPIVGVGVWHFLFRRRALASIRFLPGLLDEDVLFVYHFFAVARRGVRLPYTLYYYLNLQETLSRSLPRPELVSSYDVTIHVVDRLYAARPRQELELLRRILYPRIIRINWRRIRAIPATHRALRTRMQRAMLSLIARLHREGLLSLRHLSFHYRCVLLYSRVVTTLRG